MTNPKASFNRFGLVNRQRFNAVACRVFEVGRTVPTIAEVVASIPPEELPRSFNERGDDGEYLGQVRINGDVISRALWHLVRPRPSRPGFETVVEILVPLQGSGGAGGGAHKNPIALVASIAVLLVGAAISGGALAGVLGPVFAAGTIGATVAGAATGLGGSTNFNALAPK